ncbi:hypothetical protein SASPL_109382 [Salvia splendens]|uniref:Glycosyltransferase N-terminal domain-containing protein n=1 Tax=Salvia splendens TaxID=180675 RepID=A0A8X8YER7_SALSN|nr:hypothetical protein SASPL_109382 [Salvia splendens]
MPHLLRRPQDLAKIQFHDIPTPPIPPNPNSRYPSHLKPVAEAALSRQTAPKFTRLVVVHDPWMSHVVQDIAQIHNAESYQSVCFSAFSSIAYQCEMLGLPFPLPHPTPLPAFNMSDGAKKFASLQAESYELRSGTICNTSKSIEAAYIEVIEKSELSKNKLAWKICPNSRSQSHIIADEFHHECLQWLDKQKPGSVIFVSFGNTVTLSDEETIELAQELMQSGVKFLLVLRDADK